MVSGIYFNDNYFTFILVVVFVITLNFIKVVRNKCPNGTSVTAVIVVIHPFASSVEITLSALDVKSLCAGQRHDNLYYSDYS